VQPKNFLNFFLHFTLTAISIVVITGFLNMLTLSRSGVNPLIDQYKVLFKNRSVASLEREIESQPIPTLKLHHPGMIYVMVIDTGIGQNQDLHPFVQYDKTTDYVDPHGHGTHIAGIIIYGNKMQTLDDAVCPEVKIISCEFMYKYKNQEIKPTVISEAIDQTGACIRRAHRLGVDIINYSAYGTNTTKEEFKNLKEFTKDGSMMITSAGNDYGVVVSKEHPVYPALYGMSGQVDGIYAVASVNPNGEYSGWSNQGYEFWKEEGDDVYSTYPNDRYGKLSGTSQATAQLTHRIIKKACELNFN
jgi:subtilisin family serine protease